jgi:serine phosphatase RsbU (regulator of sigma subunit)
MTEAGTGHGDPSFDRYARMVCRALGVSTATVTIIEPGRAVFRGACGLPDDLQRDRESPLSHSFCKHVVLEQGPLIIRDAREDDRLRDNLAISDLGLISYAGWAITDHTGAIVGSLCAVGGEPQDWTAEQIEMLEDLAAACSAELSERGLRSLAAVGERAAKDLTHRSRVLLALSEGLSATRTMSDVAQAVEQIAVEQLGCLHAGIWLRSVGQAADTDHAREILTFVAPPTTTWTSALRNAVLPYDDTNPLGGAAVHGRAEYFSNKATQNALYPHLDISKQVGEARSFQPLITRGAVLGTIALIWDDPHPLTEEDRITIEALASYSAQAVQRADLLQERLDALVTLQSALLPALPESECLELAARYRPAASRDQVGGDWYDVVVLPSGATNLMVGDVVGHDIAAAAVMGQLRTMLRTIAWALWDRPAVQVQRLDRALEDLDVDAMATLLYAVVEAADGSDGRTLRWTNAGHPPPLLVGVDGATTFLDDGVPDLMVGVQPDTERSDRTILLAPGATLLLYTDGLVERRGEDITDGLDRLAGAARRHHDLGVDDFLDAVLGDLVGRELADDVAVLAVHLRA